MRRPLLILLVASILLASCGWRDSRINPRNWFGRSTEAPAAAQQVETNPLIPRRRGIFQRPAAVDSGVLIGRVTEVRVEPTNSGAIILATGIAERQGAYAARLRPVNPDLIPTEDGVLAFTFQVTYPRRPTPTGSENTRIIHEAFSISRQSLAGVRAIRIEAAQNAQESRRR